MKKKVLLIPVALSLFLVSCGGGGGGGDSNINGSAESQTIKYTVNFANTDLPAVQVEAGGLLSKPADPYKESHVFVGWYLDEGLTQEATFPLTVNSNMTLYAKYFSYKEAFAKARNNTIGNDVPGYEYDYTLHASASYMGVTFNGNTVGNAKYNKNAQSTKFYDSHVNSGSLFYDGSKYEILKDNTLHTVSLDENDVVKRYTTKDVGPDYKYDSSSFAKAVFEYDESKLKSISKTNVANEYKLATSFNVSSAIALVGNYVNHPMVERIIGELPETDVNTGMYVTFAGDKLNTYRYEMIINVSGVEFSLTYGLTFKNIGVAPSISPRTFDDVSVSSSEVSSSKEEINNYIRAYKALEHTSYDFKVKTAVDYAKKNAINATIDGFSKRKVSGGVSYYLNDYEVDTDHKNADLYKAQGLGDCHGGRVKLSTGEVHDLKKKVLGGYSDVATVTHDSADDYYLLDILSEIDSVTFIQKKTSSTKITYSIGGDDASAVEVLNYFNKNLRLNPLGECSVDVKAFGQYDSSSAKVKEFKFTIVIDNGVLSEINLTMNGSIVVSFPNSRDFTRPDDAGFKLNYNLTVTDKGASYEPAAEVSKVK